MLEHLVQDIRYAARSLRKQPAFALTVLLTLAIGIGANTTVFTLLDALVLRPLPVPHAEQLVTIGDPAKVHWSWHGSPMVDYVSYPLYTDLRDASHTLSGLYASGEPGELSVVADGGAADQPEHPAARYVTPNFFSVLALPPHLGRTFNESGSDPVAVISDGYWKRRFGAERSALGATLTINRVPVTIVGIAPPGFTGDIVGENTDLWLPIALQPLLEPRENKLLDRAASWLVMMGRLAPGITLAEARAELGQLELRSIRARLSGFDLADFNHDVLTDPVRVESAARGFSAQRQAYRETLYVLMAAVALVVLVVCTNVSNLVLARALTRVKELNVRMALGAGRRRLVAQLMTESALLGGAGAALGLLVAAWGTQGMLAIGRAQAGEMQLDLDPDARIIAFTLVSAVLCVVGFGLFPAFRATRLDLATALRGQGRSLVGRRSRARRALVVAQMALSMLLLVGSGLLVRSIGRLLRADLGLDRDHILLVHVASSKSEYTGARLQALRLEAARRAGAVPGVVAVSYSMEGIFSGGTSLGHVDIPGVVTKTDERAGIKYDMVGPNYLDALGARLLRGRDFSLHDADANVNSAVIDETMAKAYFPRGDEIGRTVVLDSVSYTIVGVVRDVQEDGVRGAPVRRMYLSQAPASDKPLSFELIVRVAREPAQYVASLRDALRAAVGPIPVGIVPLSERVKQSVSQDLLVTQVSVFFGIITLALAALGLYGVIAYSTKQRTSEFGLRAALGAQPASVAGMILHEGVTLAVAGIALGLPAGLAAARLIRARLFGVGTVDVPSLTGAIAVLISATLIASYLPARRAARVSPIEALRSE